MESKLKNENIINIVIGAIFLTLGLLTAYYTITFITLDNPKTMSSSNPLKIKVLLTLVMMFLSMSLGLVEPTLFLHFKNGLSTVFKA